MIEIWPKPKALKRQGTFSFIKKYTSIIFIHSISSKKNLRMQLTSQAIAHFPAPTELKLYYNAWKFGNTVTNYIVYRQ